jgi:hypothetical protein
MNARRKLLLAIAMSPVVVIGAACSFPDVAFAPAGGTPESGTSDSPTGDTGAVGANEDVDPDGASQEAATRSNGGPKIDAAGCTCDCDTDGFQPATGGCDGGPGPRPDCDDFDDLIKPDAGFVAAPWTSGHTPSDDWNCDGVRTKQYDYNQKCTDPKSCNGKAGFDGDPNCNEPGMYNTCLYNAGIAGVVGASCKVGSTATVTQACK